MNPRNYLNIALVLVVICLVLIAVLAPEKDAEERKTPKLGLISAKDVQTVSIEYSTGKTVQINKSEKGWVMVQPYVVIANQVQVQSLLSVLDTKVYSNYATTDHDLTKFGLSVPKVSLTFDNTTYAFGDTESITLRRYVLSGDSIYLIDDNHYRLLTGAAEQFIDLSVVPADSQIVRLVLPDLDLSKNEIDGSWSVKPDNNALSQDNLNRLVDEWLYVSAIKVEPYQKHKAAKPILLTLKNTGDLKLEMLTEPDFILARPDLGIQYRLNSELQESLFGIESDQEIDKAKN